MSPELQQAFAEFLKALMGTLERAESTVAAELPDVLYQVALLGRWTETGACLVAALFFVGGLVMLCRKETWKATMDEDEFLEGGPFRLFVRIAGGLMLLVGVLVGADHCGRMLAAWIAPKVYILQWLRGLL